MEEYRLENDVFVIEDYDKKAPFCSFLPGLTGEKGIPVWSFYVNRGQGITSFGVDNKNKPIMEFYPANVAYENTAVKGFRTFVRRDGEFFEPFFVNRQKGTVRTMYIKQNSFKIVEENAKFALKTEVEYFILPSEPLGALVRKVKFTNTGERARFELLDGMPRIIPYGVSGTDFQRMANLMRSYNTVSNLENNIPLICNRISGDDDAEILKTTGGYFYLTFDKNGTVCPVYDPSAIFDEQTEQITPQRFIDGGLDAVLGYNQHYQNKICGCFTPADVTLDSGESYEICSLCGYTHSDEFINNMAKKITADGYIDEKLAEADALAVKFTDDVATKSGNKTLDMYFRQCYLDNFLRGGYPFTFEGGKNKVVHLFSRKHGDPERDYNFFSIAAEFYSQGDGNFRDVLQNRRNDVLFHPEIGDFDIEMFFSYMQFDGYNPLFVKGTTFTVEPQNANRLNEIIAENVISGADELKKLMQGKFTAGSLINGIYAHKIGLKCTDDGLLSKILPLCRQHFEASTDKYGYWSDHWDYLLDLVDCYLKVYPDRLSSLLLDNRNYKYFDSDVFVTPRSIKYVYDGHQPRQLGSYTVDTDRYDKGYVKNDTNWLKCENGKTYRTNLLEKLISLCVNKIALLDPYQMGISMEGNRAGWCDATNGLPSMFGSGMSETFELLRLCKFTADAIGKIGVDDVSLPVELYDFMAEIDKAIASGKDGFALWDDMTSALEAFRQRTRYTISGELATISADSAVKSLESYIDILNRGIERANGYGDGYCPTYFKFMPTDFEIIGTNEGNNTGYPNVVVKAFEPVTVTPFLEGAAKQLRDCDDIDKAEKIADSVRKSELYDQKLKMYKVSGNLTNEGMQFGRIASFSRGWQENESVFLHMEYKYLYAMLNCGAYDMFYNELKTVFVPFFDAKTYGRSTLENCSFIASSANPDENLHGRGFVSRLSGSTTEVVSIWSQMFLGKTPFIYEDGKLGLRINPAISGELFDENGEISFNFLTTNKVTLHNPNRVDTYSSNIKYVTVDGERFDGDTVFGEAVSRVRDDRNSKIEIYY